MTERVVEKVVFESAMDPWDPEARVMERWWHGPVHSSQCHDNSVALIVDTADIESNRKRLRRKKGPKNLYRSFLPPPPGENIDEIISGPAYRKANQMIEKARGRHTRISAWRHDKLKPRY